ncbi:MAG: LuxR C-terminal-related transcriptional regulator [Bacteroidota bacterium]
MLNQEFTFFNFNKNLDFHQATWGNHPKDEKAFPQCDELGKIFQRQIEDIKNHRNKFGFLFQIYHPDLEVKEALAISYWQAKERYTDKAYVSFEDFLDSVHPQFYQTYLHHAHTAYRTLRRILESNRAELSQILSTKFTLRLPIFRDCSQGQYTYWWTHQEAFPFQNFGGGRVSTHFNVYTCNEEFEASKNKISTESIFPSILHYPEHKINLRYKAIYREEFLQAFFSMCTEREREIIQGLVDDKSREKIAKSLEVSEKYLKSLIGEIRKKIAPPYPLVPYFHPPQISSFIKLFRKWDPFM